MQRTIIKSSACMSGLGKAVFWAFVILFSGVTQAEFKISEMPLVSEKPMEPNLVYIHDDSLSMLSSFVPEEGASNGGGSGFLRASPQWNAIYYNPDLTYQPPFMYEADSATGVGKLVRMPNSDELTDFPRICTDGFRCNKTSTTCNNTTGTCNLRAGPNGRTSTSYPTGTTTNNSVSNNDVPAYWDYVPGYSSMRDNPNYDPSKRPEDDRNNYEYWSFRKIPAGTNLALFRRYGNSVPMKASAGADPRGHTSEYAARTKAQNDTLIGNRACPTMFREQQDGKLYYAGIPVSGVIAGEQVAVKDPIWQVPSQQQRLGMAHAHCRYSYRVYEVWESGIMQGYGPAGSAVPPWYANTDMPPTSPFGPQVCEPYLLNTNRPPDDYQYNVIHDPENGDILEPKENPGYDPDDPACTADDGAEGELGDQPSIPNLARSRQWCVRSTNYNNKNVSLNPQNNTTTASYTLVPWTRIGASPVSGSGTVASPYYTTATGVGSGSAVTCYAGRHAIGDSTGKGWYDPDVDLPDNPVSHFEFAGNTDGSNGTVNYFVRHMNYDQTGTTPANRQNALSVVNTVTCTSTITNGTGTVSADKYCKCPNGVCNNLLGAEQSRMRLITKVVNDKGEIDQVSARRRTVKEEIRNYMNWYTYYRTRTLLAKSGMSIAFAGLIDRDNTTEPGTVMRGKYVRLGYDTINSPSLETQTHNIPSGKLGGASQRGPGQTGASCYGTAANTNCIRGSGVVPFRDFPADATIPDPADPKHSVLPHPYAGKKFVERFYNWIIKTNPRGDTPLHAALNSTGQYLMTEAPWKEYPPLPWGGPGEAASYPTNNNKGGSGEVYSCRRAFAILMTDGYATGRRHTYAPTDSVNTGDTDCATTAQWGAAITKKDSGGKVVKTSQDPKKPLQGAKSPFCGQYRTYDVHGALADVTNFYWGIDLLPDVDNNVAPTKKNPAFWQHMQTFTLGLGLQGRLSDKEVNDFLAYPERIATKTVLWTNPTGLDTDYEQVDDLMHAGLNGRGGTVAAADSEEFATKLTALLTELAGDLASSTGYAGSGGPRNTANSVWDARYDGLDWVGILARYTQEVCKDEVTGKLDITRIKNGTCTPGEVTGSPVWEADRVLSDTLIKDTSGASDTTAVTNRKVFTWNGTAGIPFDRYMGGAIMDAIDVDVRTGTPVQAKCPFPIPADATDCKLGRNALTAEPYDVKFLIDWLRGDRTYEDPSAVAYSGATYFGFRNRTTTDTTDSGKQFVRFLGDIINSTPYMQGNGDSSDAGWGGFRCGQGTPVSGDVGVSCGDRNAFFSAFDVKSYKDRSANKLAHGLSEVDATKLKDAAVYVGSNDGMLHAFDALTGKELFAYIPAGVHDRLKRLADPEYNQKHHYLVDGSPFVRDSFLGGEWRSILVGHTGRGGRSFFALDVEDPKNFTADNVLWEINGADYPNLGYPVDGEAVIAPVEGLPYKWGVIFGNGYNSDNHDACLFAVELTKNPTVREICVGVGDKDQPNGLGVPIWHDPDGNGAVDLAYAGDALGNFWKFDLKSMSVGNNGQPLLKATAVTGEAQPIVARALPMNVQVSGDNWSALQLVFATGKYFEQEDLESDVKQSLYGIRDLNPVGGASGTATRSDLMVRGYKDPHPVEDEFCKMNSRDEEGNEIGYLCENYKAWRLDSAGAGDPNDKGEYPNDHGPGYGAGQNGYVIDFNAPRMEHWLGMAQGTRLQQKQGAITHIVVPTTLTLDDPCTSARNGALVELDPEKGSWTKSVLFKYIQDKSNLFVLEGSYGMEINRDGKFSISDEWLDVPDPDNPGKTVRIYVNNTDYTAQGITGNRPNKDTALGCETQGIRGGPQALAVSGVPKPPFSETICPGRTGRQSWRQIR